MDRAAWSTGIALLFMAYVIMPGALLQDAGANTSEIPQRHGIPHGRVSQAAMACHTRGAEGALKGTKGVLKGYSRGTQGVLKGCSRATQGVHSTIMEDAAALERAQQRRPRRQRQRRAPARRALLRAIYLSTCLCVHASISMYRYNLICADIYIRTRCAALRCFRT